METNGNIFYPKKPHFYQCELCDFKCSNKKDYNRHIDTKKHNGNQMETPGNIFYPKTPKSPNFTCENCNKSYAHRSGLWKHKKTCEKPIGDDNKDISCDKSVNIIATLDDMYTNKNMMLENFATDKNLILMLIKDNNELRKMMMEQQNLLLENNNKVLEICKNGTNNTTNMHNNSHNKAFNLNFFLNETCKNAMNIMEFAESIQLQLSDLEDVGAKGYVEGISNIIVKKLQSLDITERPIHCADKKREVIYIKDENKWEKESEDKKTLKRIINKVACKNQRLLPKFKELHPGCNYSSSKYADHYSKLVIEAMGGLGNNDEEKLEKIIRNIAKEVVIDKSAF